ncbi:MAG: uracil-DNA glycosylase [Firmicutes bacterium]|nr:uracil-DNA glycosylase [Bacillota bacterium]
MYNKKMNYYEENAGFSKTASQIAAYEAQVQSCRDCPLALTRTQAVCGNRCYQGDIMLLGEAPGAAEDRFGRPFAGAAGKLLQQFLAESQIPAERLYIGNAVKCRPVKPGKRPGAWRNRPPRPAEIAACRRHLQAELALVRPKLIVTLGAVPSSCFMPDKPQMGQCHGKPFAAGPYRIFPLYHPAAVMYNPGLRRAYEEDMQTLVRYIQNEMI